jgi:hypothetical protein
MMADMDVCVLSACVCRGLRYSVLHLLTSLIATTAFSWDQDANDCCGSSSVDYTVAASTALSQLKAVVAIRLVIKASVLLTMQF